MKEVELLRHALSGAYKGLERDVNETNKRTVYNLERRLLEAIKEEAIKDMN